MNTHDLVKSIIKKYQTHNPFNIIKQMSVILIYAPLLNVRGFYQYFQRNHLIYIDENLSDCDKRVVCAHELGHLLLHKNANAVYMDTRTGININKYEIEANLFAAELLIQDEVILENQHLTTEQFSRLLGYDQALIEMRLNSYRKL